MFSRPISHFSTGLFFITLGPPFLYLERPSLQPRKLLVAGCISLFTSKEPAGIHLSIIQRLITRDPFVPPSISAHNFPALLYWETCPSSVTVGCWNHPNRLWPELPYVQSDQLPPVSNMEWMRRLRRTGSLFFHMFFFRALHMLALFCFVSLCLFSILRVVSLIILILHEITAEKKNAYLSWGFACV